MAKKSFKDYFEEDESKQKPFVIAVAKAVAEGEPTAKCSCGGIIRIRKSKVNHHIHAKCETCGSEIMQ